MDCEGIILATQNSKDWTDYLAALLTPTIAVLGSLVAYLQWRTNSNRLKHELFERRYEQFMVISDFLASIMASGKSKHEEQLKRKKRGSGLTFDI